MKPYEQKAKLNSLIEPATMVMTYEQKPRGNPLIEPATMAKIESIIEKGVGGYNCTKCGYTTRKRSNMIEHVEKHVEGLEYPCNICNKIMKSSHSFRDHIRKVCLTQISA